MTNKREQIAFKKGDRLFSPRLGFVKIEAVRGFGKNKEFCIETEGEKIWYNSEQLKG